MRWRRAMALGLLLASPALAAEEKDPFDSPVWEDLKATLFEGQTVTLDDRVKVAAPTRAEDSTHVPVDVDASALGAVEEIVVFVDLNPIPKALSMQVGGLKPAVGLRVRLNEASAIRAAAKTPDGVWHVGGVYVDAMGGGCTAPRSTQVADGWEDHLGEVQARAWQWSDKGDRLRFRISHPMDTGFEENIPAFFVETMNLKGDGDRVLARFETFEPMAANPVLTVTVKEEARSAGGYHLSGRDNNGNAFAARIPPPEASM